MSTVQFVEFSLTQLAAEIPLSAIVLLGILSGFVLLATSERIGNGPA